MSVIGIDFGNSSSAIAALVRAKGVTGEEKRGKHVDILVNEASERRTAALVSFKGNQRFLGDNASNQRVVNARNTISHFKALLGKKFADPDVESLGSFYPFRMIEMPSGEVGVEATYNDEAQQFSMTQITAMYLSRLKQIALHTIENTNDETRGADAVVSIPPHFTEAQRRALLNACEIANINCLRLLSDPAAIAMQYGFYKLDLPETDPVRVAFAHVGHASTTVSICAFAKNSYRVLATASDTTLGGHLFDRALVAHFVEAFKQKYHMDPLENPRARMRFLLASEQVKKILSTGPQATLSVENVCDMDFQCPMNRDAFEDLCAPLRPRILAVCERALASAGLGLEAISSVELVGGATRIPMVRTAVEEFFHREASRTLNTEECIARGCMLMAAVLSPKHTMRKVTLTDVQPYPIRVHWEPVAGSSGNPHSDLFPRFSKMPVTKKLTLVRAHPFDIWATYLEPESLPAGTNPLIGRWTIKDVPAVPEGSRGTSVKILVRLDAHGVVTVQEASYTEEYEVEEAIPEEKPTASHKPAPAASAQPAAATATAAPGAEAEAPATPEAEGAAAPMEQVEPCPSPAPSPTPSPPDSPTACGSPPPAEAEADTAPMDIETPAEAAEAPVEDPAPEEPAAPRTRMVKHTRSHKLPFDATCFGLAAEAMKAAKERQYAMAAQDKLIRETLDAKNALEEYIYSMRDRIDGELRQYVPDAAHEDFTAALQLGEDWLYEDGYDAQRGQYVSRLEDLRKHGDPIVRRQEEFAARPQAVAALLEGLERIRTDLAAPERAHLTEEQRHKVTAEADGAEAWLTERLTEQEGREPSVDPAFLCRDVYTKLQTAHAACTPILNTPKPKPKEEAKAKNDADAASAEAPAPADVAPAEAAVETLSTEAPADPPAEATPAAPEPQAAS